MTQDIATFLSSSALLLLLTAPPMSAAPLTNPLTADQVTCDELQLEHLALRAAVVERLAGNGTGMVNHPSLFLWHAVVGGGGAYSGLAVTDGVMGTAGNLVRSETQLALDMTLHSAVDSLNPARPLVAQATVVRREQDSNLVAPTPMAPYLTIVLALEPNALDPFFPAIPLQLNNLAAASDVEQPAAHADGAGRGISQDNLTASCESALTPFDEGIFAILSRTVRLAQCALKPGALAGCNPDGSAYNITLFRGTDPQTYRANVYFYAVSCDKTCAYGVSKVAYEFKINWDTTGTLTTGEVSVLPPCPNGPAPGCSSMGNGTPMFILPPLWAGHGQQGQPQFNLGTFVWDDFPGSPNNVLAATVNWQALLAGSAWN